MCVRKTVHNQQPATKIIYIAFDCIRLHSNIKMAMSQAHRKALDRSLLELCQDLYVNDVTIHLISKEVLTDEDQENLDKGTRTEKVKELVKILKRKRDEAFDLFVESLKVTQDFLAETLQKHEADVKEQLAAENRASDTGSSSPNSPIECAGNAQNGAKKKIFVSFSFKIVDRVTKLKDRIEEHIGKDSCWICTEEIRGGNNMKKEITQAIEDAHIILCMMNKDFINSEPCEEEVSLSSLKKKYIIPILFERMDLSNLKKNNGKASQMELTLGQLLYINMYDQTKKEDEFKKLITTIQEQLLLKEQDPCGPSQKKNKTD